MKKKKRRMTINASGIFNIIMIMIYLILLIICVYKLISNQRLSNCVLEFILLLLLTVVIVFRYFNISVNYKTKKFRLKLSKKKRKIRVVTYINESILLALAVTTIMFTLVYYDVIFINFYSIIRYNAILSIFLVLILTYIASFIIIFICDYLLSEFLIRKYYSLSE